MKRFLITAYDASLWTDAPHWSMQAPFALTIRYNFAFSSNSIVSRALKEMKHDDSRLGDDTLVRYRALMSGLFPDVRSGDEITGLYAPGGTIRFFYNGQPTGHVDDVAFANAFFGIWLSSETSEPDLRAQLLQLHP